MALSPDILRRTAEAVTAVSLIAALNPIPALADAPIRSYPECAPDGHTRWVDYDGDWHTYIIPQRIPTQCGNPAGDNALHVEQTLTRSFSDYGPYNIALNCFKGARAFEIKTQPGKASLINSVSGGLNPERPKFTNNLLSRESLGRVRSTHILSCVTENGVSVPVQEIEVDATILDEPLPGQPQ